MGRLTVLNNVSLDGVMQSPGRPDEDTRGGFSRGGWASGGTDETIGRRMAEGMSRPGAMLFGHRTFQDFAGWWPYQTDNPFTPHLNRTRKYVVSRTGTEQPTWENSTLLTGDAATTVAELKAGSEFDLVVLGSGDLVQTLRDHQLVDHYTLMIHPVILGSGRKLFPDGTFEQLRLVDSLVSDTGVVLAEYEPVR